MIPHPLRKATPDASGMVSIQSASIDAYAIHTRVYPAEILTRAYANQEMNAEVMMANRYITSPVGTRFE